MRSSSTQRGARSLTKKLWCRLCKPGNLAGAGLDVFENEPKVHPALIAMDNVTLLPHVGSATAETRMRMAMLASTNLLAALRESVLPIW